MDFSPNKKPIEIKKVCLVVLISEFFNLVLMGSGTKNNGKTLISQKIEIKLLLFKLL